MGRRDQPLSIEALHFFGKTTKPIAETEAAGALNKEMTMFKKSDGKHRVSKRHIGLLIICVAALDIGFVSFFYLVTIRREIKQYVEYLIAIGGGVSTQMTSLGLFLERDAVHLSHDSAIKEWVSQAQKSLQAEGGGKGGAETLEIRNALNNYLYTRFHWIKRMKKGMGKMPGMPDPPPPTGPNEQIAGPWRTKHPIRYRP